MATLPPRTLKIGKIIDKTLGVIERSMSPVLLYIVGLTAINSGIGYYLLSVTAPMQQMQIGLAKFVIGIVFAYFLLDAILRKTGLLSREGGQVLLPYVGLSIITAIGVVLGLIVFILPGLIFMARWSIAQPLLVGRGAGIKEALSASWERTKGNEVQIIGAALALILPLVVILILASVFFGSETVVGIVVTELATSAMTVVSTGVGVAIYGLMTGGEREAQVFA